MRSIDEQMNEIKKRKDAYRDEKALRRRIAADASACGVSFALLAVVACFLPRLREVSALAPIGRYGSLILALPAAGYVLIALLSFILGSALTLLLLHCKKLKEKERESE